MIKRFKRPMRLNPLDAVLLVSFLISGTCALIYQVGWQRSLYGLIGVDIDSVTIIVSVFMLGIGFGGMLGGWIADAFPSRRIQCYALAEVAIALYGLMSLYLMDAADNWFASSGGLVARGFISFVFLVVPTTLMGMTLPILTMAFNQWRKNIGISVGQLYFFNTLGAAIGAGLVPFFLMPMMPLDKIIVLAACGNFTVAAAGLLAYRWQRYRGE